MNIIFSKRHWTIGTLLSLVNIAVESAPPTLSGSNVIWFPNVDVPFLQSEFIISNGKKHPDGGCTFPLASEGSPYPLLAGQHWITIQRAFDPDTCQELLERGVIDLNINPEAEKLLEIPDNSSVNTHIQKGASEDSATAAASGYSKSGKVRVWFTDKNNPYIGALNDMGVSYDGFLLSSNQIEGTFTQSADCRFGTYDVEWTEAVGNFGWYRDIQTVFGLTFGCGYWMASVSARHANKTQLEPFFDCRDKVNISYSPMTLRVNMLSPNALEGEVSVTGDFDRCGEYAQRFQDGPY